MSTGPEHYLKAEQLLAGTDFKIEGEPFHNPPSERDIAAAQAHATLALAAATATAADIAACAADIRNHSDVDAWNDVTAQTAPDEDNEDPDDGFTASELHEMGQHEDAVLDAAAEAGESR